MIEVDIDSEKLVKLPKVQPRKGKLMPATSLEDNNIKIAKNRECLAYTIRLKNEEEKKPSKPDLMEE